MEHVVDQRASGVDPRAFADLFERLIWLLADNGSGIRSVLSTWLEGDDVYRVEVALGLDEGFLFDSREAMVAAFNRLQARWPDVKPRCQEILEAWDKSVAPPS
jgi:hypothetical protein